MRILFLDDSPERHQQVAARTVGHELVACYTLDQFVDALFRHDHFDHISLDHDLNDFESRSFTFGQEATGLDACGFLVNGFRDKCPPMIHIHSVNPCGAQSMKRFLEGRGFRVYWQPFDVCTANPHPTWTVAWDIGAP